MLIEQKLNVTWQCALIAQKANCIQGCLPSSMASRSREGILPLCSTLWTPRPGVLHPVLETSAQERHGAVGEGPEECHRNDQRTGPPLLGAKAERVGLFSLEKRRLWGDLTAAFQYLREPTRKLEGLFTRACRDRTRSNGFKLKEGRFRVDTRKKLFSMRVMKHLHRLPREVMDAYSLEVFKARLDGALSNLV